MCFSYENRIPRYLEMIAVLMEIQEPKTEAAPYVANLDFADPMGKDETILSIIDNGLAKTVNEMARRWLAAYREANPDDTRSDDEIAVSEVQRYSAIHYPPPIPVYVPNLDFADPMSSAECQAYMSKHGKRLAIDENWNRWLAAYRTANPNDTRSDDQIECASDTIGPYVDKHYSGGYSKLSRLTLHPGS